MLSGVEFREATFKDLHAILALNEFFGENHNLSLEDAYAIMNYGKVRDTFFYVATLNDWVVGSAVLSFQHKLIHHGSVTARIDELVIKDDQRGKGIGLEFVEFLVKKAYDANAYKICLDCEFERVNFYERCGFKPTTFGMRKDIDG